MPRRRLSTIRSYDLCAPKRGRDGNSGTEVKIKKSKPTLNLPVAQKELREPKLSASVRRFQQMVQAAKGDNTEKKKKWNALDRGPERNKAEEKKKLLQEKKKLQKPKKIVEDQETILQDLRDPRHVLALKKNKKKRKRKNLAAKKIQEIETKKLEELSDQKDSIEAKPQRLRYEQLVHNPGKTDKEEKYFAVEKIPFGTVADRPPKLEIKTKGKRQSSKKGNEGQVTGGKKRKRKGEVEAEEEEASVLHQSVVAALERSINKGKQLEAAAAEFNLPNNTNQLEHMRYQAQIAYERYKKKKI